MTHTQRERERERETSSKRTHRVFDRGDVVVVAALARVLGQSPLQPTRGRPRTGEARRLPLGLACGRGDVKARGRSVGAHQRCLCDSHRSEIGDGIQQRTCGRHVVLGSGAHAPVGGVGGGGVSVARGGRMGRRPGGGAGPDTPIGVGGRRHTRAGTCVRGARGVRSHRGTGPVCLELLLLSMRVLPRAQQRLVGRARGRYDGIRGRVGSDGPTKQ